MRQKEITALKENKIIKIIIRSPSLSYLIAFLLGPLFPSIS